MALRIWMYSVSDIIPTDSKTKYKLTVAQMAELIAIPNDTGDKDYIGEFLIKVWTSILGADCFADDKPQINPSQHAISDYQWKQLVATMVANCSEAGRAHCGLDFVNVGPSSYHEGE